MLAISNIAWKPVETQAAYALLQRLGVHGLEVAPGILFPDEPDPFKPTDAALAGSLEQIRQAGLSPVSMQSLLFGVQDALLFGDEAQRERFVLGLMRAIDLAARLGISNLVVGSPANRVIPSDMPRSQADALAAEVFTQLGDYAQTRGCRLAMEPNPAVYGTNFLTDIAETAAFVRRVDHPAVRLNFDIGALHINGEFNQIEELLAQHAALISHVHVSEPNLAPVPADPEALVRSCRALAGIGWKGWVSIEMRATSEDRLAYVETAVRACLEAMDA